MIDFLIYDWDKDRGPRHKTGSGFMPNGRLSILDTPQGRGKTSLGVTWAVNNSLGNELWPGGPVGDKRETFFFCGGSLQAQVVCEKAKALGGSKQKIRIIDGFKYQKGFIPVSDYESGLHPQTLYSLASRAKPAHIIFDFFRFRVFECEKALKRFNNQVKNLKTAFIALKNRWIFGKRADVIKAVPCLGIWKKQADHYLYKKSGFAHNPKGLLHYRFESLGNTQAIKNLEYLDKHISEIRAQKRYEDQGAILKALLAQLFIESKALPTREVKSLARKAGVSTYFLKNMQWSDYGYQTKGQGYGADYNQVVLPIEKH